MDRRGQFGVGYRLRTLGVSLVVGVMMMLSIGCWDGVLMVGMFRIGVKWRLVRW